ncbi:unnamed protein product [Meloidogyne enterolobii]|uniref:Uncharacterized protein n=1 Tax=Meloidogyne enterolobii TaxID=390850 RepID=A0ACB1ATS2_MELEN
MRRLSTFDKRDVSNETNIKLSEVQQSLQDTKTTLTKMRDQQNKTLSGFTANMEENKLKLSEMRQSLDQQNKTLVETNKKLSEMKQLQWHMFIGKNITNNKPLEFSPTSQHYSNNL